MTILPYTHLLGENNKIWLLNSTLKEYRSRLYLSFCLLSQIIYKIFISISKWEFGPKSKTNVEILKQGMRHKWLIKESLLSSYWQWVIVYIHNSLIVSYNAKEITSHHHLLTLSQSLYYNLGRFSVGIVMIIQHNICCLLHVG